MIALVVLLALAGDPTSTPSTPQAQTPAATPHGTYVIADAAGAAAAVEAAINEAVADVVFFMRPFAAGTLREANVVDAALVVAVDAVDAAARMHVRFGGRAIATTENVAADVVVDAHGAARVLQRRDGGDLVQTAVRKEGTRTVRIHAVDAAADVIDVDVRFDSPELRRPLHYRLRYRR
jgi:hypothetical protein